MTWGFTGKDASIEDIIANVGPGWGDLVKGLVIKLQEAGWDGVVCQVKEKFGGLRFYIGTSNDEIDDIIRAYETKSFSVCEDCGKPGAQRYDDWIKTLCDSCFSKDKI